VCVRENEVHEPVLLEEVIYFLQVANEQIHCDLTLGAGGHAEVILERSAPDGILYGLDRDSQILEIAGSRLERFGQRIRTRQGNAADAGIILSDVTGKADGVLFDLGVSSLQIDRPERGFSFQKDGPLDMRMDLSSPLTAETFLNTASRDQLIHAIGVLGEENRAGAVVNAILDERRKHRLLRTREVAEIVERIYGRRGGRIHPATRSFRGIRMVVNAELESLEKGLAAALKLLKNGGRLAVIAFHSGEDRIVKEFMKTRRSRGEISLLTRKVIKPGVAEIKRNRRSRSARLRVAVKDRAE